MELEALFAEIDRWHHPRLGNDVRKIEALEQEIGLEFPDDFKAFHRRYISVSLFYAVAPLYRFVPASEIRRTRIDIHGADSDDWGPATWYTVCDLLDGNYIAVDIASNSGNECNYIDCFHETFAQSGCSTIVAQSFRELLERTLHGSSQKLYYLAPGFSGYGDAIKT